MKESLHWILRNSLCHGPIPYHPPTQEEAEKMKITLEEAREIYDEVWRSFKLVEVEPGWWDSPRAIKPKD